MDDSTVLWMAAVLLTLWCILPTSSDFVNTLVAELVVSTLPVLAALCASLIRILQVPCYLSIPCVLLCLDCAIRPCMLRILQIFVPVPIPYASGPMSGPRFPVYLSGTTAQGTRTAVRR
jgi:hypothetical protein